MEESVKRLKLWYFENFNFLKAMTPEEKVRLSSCSVMKKVKKDTSVYLPLDASSTIYFLKEGRVKIASYSDDGRELIHAILRAGQIFGELALTGEKQRESFAVATEDALVCQIDIAQFEDILKSNSRLNLEIVKLIGFRLKRVRNRLERMWFKSAEDRIKFLLGELCEDYGVETYEGIEIRLHLKHHEIASLAATARQTASSVLSKLEKEGQIAYNRKVILLKRKAALAWAGMKF